MPVAATKTALAPAKGEGLFSSSEKHRVVLCLVLVACTLLLYNPVAHFDFVNFDDDHYVFDNPHVRAGLQWATVPWAFRTTEAANWHPVTWLSHALDARLFGMNPAGHHYVNLLLHTLNALLLFLLLAKATGSIWRSFLVAALFAVHPLNVESVAWVAERKNVLCTLFFLLALAAYGWYVRKPGIGRYLAVAFLFALGLMSKPMVITLPFVLLLLDYWPLRRMHLPGKEELASETSCGASPVMTGTQSVWRLCWEKIPLLVLSLGSAIITMIAQKAGGAVRSVIQVPILARLENAIVSYVLYIAKTIWPSHLAPLYPLRHAVPAWEVLGSTVLLLAITAAVLKYREHRYLAAGWFWYVGMMVPMIGLVQVGNQAMADRYAYLPLLGVFVGIVWGAADWASRNRVAWRYTAIAGLALLAGFSAVTHIQLRYWQNSFTLWSHTLAVTRRNFVAENNMGNALTSLGRYDEAIGHFRTAVQIEPADPYSHLNIGVYTQQHGDLREAAMQYQLVLRLTNDPQLGAYAYINLGSAYFSRRDYPHARANFEAALKLQPNFALTLINLGLLAQRTGDLPQAIDYYHRAVTAEPSDISYLLLGQALEQNGQSLDAQAAYGQAQQLSKDFNHTRQVANELLSR